MGCWQAFRCVTVPLLLPASVCWCMLLWSDMPLNYSSLSFPLPLMDWGYWRQRADQRLGDPPQGIQEPLMVRDGWKIPKRTTLHCTTDTHRSSAPPMGIGGALLLCVSVVQCWKISLERDLLSVLSIFSIIFLCVFIATQCKRCNSVP